MSPWDNLKAVPIDTVAAHLGINMPNRASMRCPFPDHEDTTPSFSIIRRTNSFFCHGCRRGGSVIDFVMYARGVGAATAADWLAKEFGVDSTGLSLLSGVRRPAQQTRIMVVPKEYLLDPAVYESFLRANKMADPGRRYLNNRSIHDRTIAAFNLGFIENATVSLERLLGEVGSKAAELAGLVTNRYGKLKLIFPGSSVIFPFYARGRIVYLQSRTIDAGSRIRWMGLNGVPKAVYNGDAINRAREIYLCEGCLDVLSAHELRLTAIGVTGAATALPDQVVKALRNKVVYVIPDNDTAGSSMAAATLSTLRRAGIQSVVQNLPKGKDLNEYLVLSRAKH